MSEEAISGSDLEPSLNSEEEEEMEEEEDGENDGDDEDDAGGEHLFQFTPPSFSTKHLFEFVVALNKIRVGNRKSILIPESGT